MKIRNTTTTLTICYALLHANMHANTSNGNWDEEFITKMNNIQKQFQDITNHMQSTIKNVQEQIIYSDNSRTATSPSGVSLNIQNHNINHYYQQSSSSLSFANADKAIKIVEQKDNQKVTYIISITDKIPYGAATQEPSDIIIDLQKLASYVKKSFQSQQADKILHECINALAEEHKNRVMNVETTVEGNQTKYTIEIAHKIATDADIKTPTKKQSRKNKKLANRS